MHTVGLSVCNKLESLVLFSINMIQLVVWEDELISGLSVSGRASGRVERLTQPSRRPLPTSNTRSGWLWKVVPGISFQIRYRHLKIYFVKLTKPSLLQVLHGMATVARIAPRCHVVSSQRIGKTTAVVINDQPLYMRARIQCPSEAIWPCPHTLKTQSCLSR